MPHAPSDSHVSGSPFWAFSLRFYGLQGVPPACIALQEDCSIDVNLLLFCLFAAHERRRLAAADIVKIHAASEPWKMGAVVPLRAARVYLREPALLVNASAAAALRQKVKAVELDAERMQQEGLFAAFPLQNLGEPAANRHAAAQKNLEAFAAAMGRVLGSSPKQTLIAAFDQLGDTNFG